MKAMLKAVEYVYPDYRLTNDDLKKEFPDYDFTKFEEKVGVHARYVTAPDETALDLAVKACDKLFLKVDKDSIDYIIYCTQSPEYILPTTSCILQERLGLSTKVGAFDFNLGCSGYVYGLSLANGLICSQQASNVLLITAESYTKYLHQGDKSNRAIFGDAATASLISTSSDNGFGKFLFGTDGSGYAQLIIKNGGTKYKIEKDPKLKRYGSDNLYTDNHLYMNGPEIFNFTSKVIPVFTNELLEENQKSINDIQQFIYHQANAFMLDFLRKKIKIEKDKFFINLKDGGNTVSNTIPIALKKYFSENKFDQPQNILIAGFGVGLSWAGGLIRTFNL